MKHLFFTVILLTCNLVIAQNKFETKLYFGLQKNNHAAYDREIVKKDGFIVPINEYSGNIELLQKNEIGTMYGINFTYKFKGRNGIGFDINQTQNTGSYKSNYFIHPINYEIIFDEIKLNYSNINFAIIYHRYQIIKNLNAGIGIGYLVNDSQIISLYNDAMILSNYIWTELNFPLMVSYDIIKNDYLQVGIEARTNITPIIGGVEDYMLYPYLKINF